jgi:hypothetical protein
MNAQHRRWANPARTSGWAALAASLVILASTTKGAISVGPAGSGTLTFDTVPGVTEWSTRNTGGAGTDIGNTVQMATAVQTNAASLINVALGQATTVSPAPTADALARWNSGNKNLQTCPTGVGYTRLLATLQNNTGNAATALTLEYDYGILNAAGTTTAEELPGHQVYYSLTGLPDSWTLIPAL